MAAMNREKLHFILNNILYVPYICRNFRKK